MINLIQINYLKRFFVAVKKKKIVRKLSSTRDPCMTGSHWTRLNKKLVSGSKVYF